MTGYVLVIRKPGTKRGKRVGSSFESATLARTAAYEALQDASLGTVATIYRHNPYGSRTYWYVAKDREGVFDIGHSRQAGVGKKKQVVEDLSARLYACFKIGKEPCK